MPVETEVDRKQDVEMKMWKGLLVREAAHAIDICPSCGHRLSLYCLDEMVIVCSNDQCSKESVKLHKLVSLNPEVMVLKTVLPVLLQRLTETRDIINNTDTKVKNISVMLKSKKDDAVKTIAKVGEELSKIASVMKDDPKSMLSYFFPSLDKHSNDIQGNSTSIGDSREEINNLLSAIQKMFDETEDIAKLMSGQYQEKRNSLIKLFECSNKSKSLFEQGLSEVVTWHLDTDRICAESLKAVDSLAICLTQAESLETSLEREKYSEVLYKVGSLCRVRSSPSFTDPNLVEKIGKFQRACSILLDMFPREPETKPSTSGEKVLTASDDENGLNRLFE